MVTEKQMANLIPFSERTESEQREIRSAGGTKSGEARRQRKSVAECLKMFRDMNVMLPEMKSALKKSGVNDPEEMTYAMAMAMQFMNAAMRGNSQMARLVMEMLGEVKQSQTSVTVNNNTNPLASLSDEELFSEIKRLKEKGV